jgi:hypothetical protein
MGQLVQPVSLLIWLSDSNRIRLRRTGLSPCLYRDKSRDEVGSVHVKCEAVLVDSALRPRFELPADTRRAVLARSI